MSEPPDQTQRAKTAFARAISKPSNDGRDAVGEHEDAEQAALVDYYSQRAHEYERIYHKPERQADLERLRTHLRFVLSGRRVLELACGTGYWTAAIADAVGFVFATDASDEVLGIARAKSLDPARVTFARADAYNPRLSRRDFDAGLAAFWWSHVPKARLTGFLEAFHATLLPGAGVVFADNRYAPDSSTPISRTDSEGNSFQQRRLDDGSTQEVLKNFPSPDELRRALAPYADSIEVTTLDYFWCASYELRTAVHAPSRMAGSLVPNHP